jgi:hypothetical protein
LDAYRCHFGCLWVRFWMLLDVVLDASKCQCVCFWVSVAYQFGCSWVRFWMLLGECCLSVWMRLDNIEDAFGCHTYLQKRKRVWQRGTLLS